MSTIDPQAVPFWANTEDDTHCFQASCRMMLGYFLPNREFSWQELEKLSAKKANMSTWPQKMLLSFDALGFDVMLIEGFDGRAFIARGEQYLIDEFGRETAEWQIRNSDIDQERVLYQEAYDAGVRIETRIPGVEDIIELMGRGYLVSPVINSHALNEKPGYSGHSVVILSADDTSVSLHDPGLPPMANRTVSRELFEHAWASPNETAKSLMAIKPKEKS